MSFRELRDSLIERLEQADRGDRGWWLVTRVHLSASRLRQIAGYLYDAGASEGLRLTRQHYRDLAGVLDINNSNPRQTINRHYFLAMETPLRLLEKANPNSWDEVILTGDGQRLATSENTVAVFERLLREIRFCRVPWYTTSRATEYEEFDVQPYPATLSILDDCQGYIDIDEFDLFVSRIRGRNEIETASAHIAEFRQLQEEQKAQLRYEVESRIPPGRGADERKPYNNWRDMARHTFSLFSLGESAVRIDNTLVLAKSLSTEILPAPATGERRRRSRELQRPRTPPLLRIPDVDASEELLVPPAPPQGNTGADAELLVGKLFASNGWQVVYYNQRRGYGFDLWVQKDGKAFVIEVKSFSGPGGSVSLTPLEFEAAEHHGDNFLLVIVENAATNSPRLYAISNPVSVLEFTERQLRQFYVSRTAWSEVADDLD